MTRNAGRAACCSCSCSFPLMLLLPLLLLKSQCLCVGPTKRRATFEHCISNGLIWNFEFASLCACDHVSSM